MASRCPVWSRAGTRSHTVFVVAVAATVGGCAPDAAPTSMRARLQPEALTPALARLVGPAGKFILGPERTQPPGQISEGQARGVALRLVRDIQRSQVADWRRSSGIDIDPKVLTPCDRPMYAASPYQSIEGAQLSLITRRTFGPHWVVPMCANGDLQVVVAFSGLATEIVGVADKATVPWENSDALSYGVPRGVPLALFSPEGAATHAFEAMKRRVNQIPELVAPPMPGNPLLVRWRVTFETPLSVKGIHSGKGRTVETLTVGFVEGFTAPGIFDSDPDGAPPATEWVDVFSRAPFTVVLSHDVPGSLERVTPEAP